DVTIRTCDVTFREVRLEPPFVLASGTISEFTVAYVDVEVQDRTGRVARGRGATILSVLWAWPDPVLTVVERDAQLRELMIDLSNVVGVHDHGDPFEHWGRLGGWLAANPDWNHVPKLAAGLALGAIDNAIHDAWARAAGANAYTIYDEAHLSADL